MDLGRGCPNLRISPAAISLPHVMQNKRCNLKHHPSGALSSIWLSNLDFFKAVVQNKLVMKSHLTAGKLETAIGKSDAGL